MRISRRGLIGVCATVLLLIIVYNVSLYSNESFVIDGPLLSQPARLAINTSGCKIPLLDPLHPSVAHFIKRLSPLDCSRGKASPVSVEGNTLVLNQNEFKCTYFYIYRKKFSDKETMMSTPHLLKGRVNITDEFVKVICKKENVVVYEDHFAFILPKPEVEDRIKNVSTSSPRAESLRIVLLGLDSVSKNQYLRHMLKTDKFIRTNLTFIELHGYNKVGKDTYTNMVPFLAGKLPSEVSDVTKVPADILPLIWKDFASGGYRTLFSEDLPDGAIFNYGKKGFTQQPADYYLRPFSLIAEKSYTVKKGKRGCFNRRLETSVIIQWMEDFLDAFPEDPLFAFTFLTRLSHDYINDLSYQDEPVFKFLERLQKKGHFNNTVVFLFGDHGFRFGDIRSTYVGRMESRLPTMFILLPPWLPVRYPQMYKNLRENQKRLTTPFDIYATLNDILHFTGHGEAKEGSGRSISLFSNPVPENRTCKDAAIRDHWCGCVQRRQASQNDKHVQTSAKILLQKINALTAVNRDVCAELTLTSIQSASFHQVDLGEDVDKSDKYTNYLVTFSVEPSLGVFEGTVWYNPTEKKYVADNSIERVNRYGNQSVCVDSALLKPYCYCVGVG